MFYKDWSDFKQWCGLIAAVSLLALGLVLMGSQAVTADSGPAPAQPAFAPPAFAGPAGQMVGPQSVRGPQQVNPGFSVDLTQDVLWGLVNPGDLVTVTRTVGGAAYGAAEADGVGFFWTPLYDGSGSGQPVDIASGNTLLVYVNGGLAATLTPLPIGGQVDVLADQVTGTIVGAGAGVPVTVTVGVGGNPPGAGAPLETATTDASGNFTVTFSIDLKAQNLVAVDYQAGGNYVRGYLYPDPPVFLVEQYGRIDGYAPRFQTITATVYITYPTDVRWQHTAFADAPHGFYSISQDWGEDDAEPGDLVEVEFEDGTVLSTTLFALGDLTVDPALDRVSGAAPAGETVNVSMWQWQGGEQVYAETATVAAAGDLFTATFATADLRTRDEVYVAIADADGNQTQLKSGAPFLDAYMDPFSEWDCVVWRVDGPNLPVTLTIEVAPGEIYTRENPIGPSDAGNSSRGGCYLVWGPGWGPIDFAPGNTVTLKSPTWEGSLVLADVSWAVDTLNDQVSGDAPPGDLAVSVYQWRSDQYPIHGSTVQTATAASPYTATFAGYDLRDGGTLDIRHFDPTTDFASWYRSWQDIEYQYFEVQPPNGVGGVPPHADEVVTATLYTAGGVEIASTSDDHDGDPWRFWLDDFGGNAIEPGQWVTVTGESGWTAGLQVPTLTVQVDADTDLIWGEGPKSLLMIDHEGASGRFVPVDGYALDASYFGDDLHKFDWIGVYYQAPNGNRVQAEFYWPQLRLNVNYGHDWIAGQTLPGVAVTVSVAGKATATGQADSGGDFGTWWWAWDPEPPNIEPGDVITAATANMTATVNPVGAISGTLDLDADTISGAISAPWFSPLTLTLTVICEVWEWGGPQIIITDVNPAGGSYFCDFGAEGWDIQPGQDVAVRYTEPDGDTVINMFQAPWMRVNYGHDWVGGTYPAGHTFWITVTDGVGAPKGYAQLDSTPGGGWGGDGFETRDEDWLAGRPDIAPYDLVYFQSDDGYYNVMEVGEISGTLDVSADSVGGPIYANWFTSTLDVECHPWGAPPGTPGKNSTAEPDGSAPYLCQWDPNTEWDILPGQDVAVMYLEPDDGDRVINVFQEPAPDMSVEKWTEGGGEVAPGGPVVFTLRYRNEGNAEATTVYLTDTLPVSTTYVTDTSGLPATVGGGQVVWSFGPVTVGLEAQFQLVLTNTANASDTLHNEVDIYTEYDSGDWNDHAEAQVHVSAAQPDLYVNKNPNPGDPASGQTMLWEIDYGNNGPVASGPVVLSDTLPLSTSIVSWVSEGGYSLWTDHSTADQLILEAPTLPGYWGDRILLRLLVDGAVPVGAQLTNTVEITTAGDANPGDNWQMRDDVWVNDPRWNAYLNKNFGWGQLVPGGEVVYDVHLRNQGNMATQTWLTDTFPTDTSFEDAWIWTGAGEVPFPPDYVDGEIAVWDLDVMEPGAWYNLGIRLAISDTVDLGTVFTNCAEIAIDGDDGWPDDNVDCVVDTVREPGPNLRVDKNYQWDEEGQIQFDLYIQNIGTQLLEPVWLTDTYPAGASFNDDWWVDHGPWITLTHDAPNRQLVFWGERFSPGETARVRFRVDVDNPGEQGLCFTNTVEAPIPGDVWPADNEDQATACTGPDVYVEKWLSGGEPRPGEIVTFTVEFGNQNRWPWDGDDQFGSHVTDTLPAEMTFITTAAHWDPNDPWTPAILPGNVLTWSWGTMWSNNWWRFDLVVQISDTLEGGDVITNTAEAYGDSPNDVDPIPGNNAFELPVTILNPKFEVNKVYTGSRVAGTAVTYTLVVSNVGSEDGTNVVLSDTLPANLTYGGGDGAFDGSDITWTFSSIAAYSGTASGWFSATLPCAGTVTNDAYRVVSSDQGVTTPDGDPVSLTIVAPALTPSFDQSAATVNVSQTVYLTDTSTFNGAAIAAWAWDFGDGETASGATASHAYDAAGSYTVTLTITDTCGYSAAAVVRDAVTALSGCVAPTGLGFTYLPTHPVILSPVAFEASVATGTAPISYSWSFGDGGSASGQTAQHTYTTKGAYTAIVTATNACGAPHYSQSVAIAPVRIYLPIVLKKH